MGIATPPPNWKKTSGPDAHVCWQKKESIGQNKKTQSRFVSFYNVSTLIIIIIIIIIIRHIYHIYVYLHYHLRQTVFSLLTIAQNHLDVAVLKLWETEDSDSNMLLEVMLNWESTNKNFTESPCLQMDTETGNSPQVRRQKGYLLLLRDNNKGGWGGGGLGCFGENLFIYILSLKLTVRPWK